MNDPLLIKLMRSQRFQKLSKPEQMVEIQDYKFQKKRHEEGAKND